MTTLQTGATGAQRRSRTTLWFSAVAAGVVLVLAAAWPNGASGPAVMSSAGAHTPATAAVVRGGLQDTSVPDAAAVFAGKNVAPEDAAPTF